MKRLAYLLVLFLAMAGFRNDKDRTISGTVYDQASKQPLAGVSVKVEGSQAGVVTDAKGQYRIGISDMDIRLVFGTVGYKTQVVKLPKSGKLDVWLKADESQLDEVVVVGYGTKKIQASNMNTALAGRVAGIAVGRRASERRPMGIYSPAPAESESYKGVKESGFINPLKEALSTFAVDVDAASYSNVRRFINQGQLPPEDAVRIEEMINYFQYTLPGPSGNDPVAISTELSEAPWNPKHQLLRIGLKAKNVPTAQLPAANLVFLIDVSGSMMDANKLPLVKSSLKLLVDQLRASDHVAIVTYAGSAGLSLPSTPGDKKMKIKDAIDGLEAGGSTAGGAGIKLAYQTARDHFIQGGNNRIILATDGDFNVGASSDDDMEQLIEKERKSGVSLSVFGYGMGNLKDSKMETLADKGHGNYAYVDNITEARKSMVTAFGGTFFTVAKDVKMQVEFNPARVQAYRLIGYENRLLAAEDFNNDQKIGGDMGVGHTVTALYELVPAGLKDPFAGSADPLKYQQTDKKTPGNPSAETATVKFRYKKTDDKNSSSLKQVVVQGAPVALANSSDDYRFASAVAELGMLLRDSEYKQQASYDGLIDRAKKAKGMDVEGYRSEFIRLAESAKLLSASNAMAVKE